MEWANGQILVSLEQPNGSYTTRTITFDDWEGRLKVLIVDYVAKKRTLDVAIANVEQISLNSVYPANPIQSHVQLQTYMNTTETLRAALIATIAQRDALQAVIDDVQRQIYLLAYMGSYGSQVQSVFEFDIEDERYRLEVGSSQAVQITLI